MTKVYFYPVHLTRFYRNKFGHKRGEFPVTEEMSDQVLSLPMYPTMTKEEGKYITKIINDFSKGGIK